MKRLQGKAFIMMKYNRVIKLLIDLYFISSLNDDDSLFIKAISG